AVQKFLFLCSPIGEKRHVWALRPRKNKLGDGTSTVAIDEVSLTVQFCVMLDEDHWSHLLYSYSVFLFIFLGHTHSS
ncbi:unnamed protein product, partial [Linum tenue]